MKGLRKAENLNMEEFNYAPSDSEDDYESNEKMLLEKVRQGHQRKQDVIESEEAIFRVHSSSDDDDDDDDHDHDHEEEEDEDEEDEGVGSNMDSDIEGRSDDGEFPSSKAWGSKSKNFYHTDYVDQDFGGFSRAEEEEVAMMEEKEALAIQQRLAAELEDVDYTLGLSDKIKEKKEKVREAAVDSNKTELIKTDLSRLSQRERIILLENDSPEFFGLINDFKARMLYAQNNLVPIREMIKSSQLQECPFSDYISTQFQLTLNYCTNILFYILLKAQRVNVSTHPVVPRLYTYRTLLRQMDPVDKQVILPQIENILMQKQQCNSEILSNQQTRPEKSRKLKLLTSYEGRDEKEQTAAKKKKSGVVNEPKKCQINEKEGVGGEKEELAEKKAESEIEESVDTHHIPDDVDENEKRPITYQIAKNKGLTPHRKKELRNPRVKHRNKYRKAKIRRKGQVREARQELQRYAGEISGIKASVCKSVKLK